MMDQPDFDRTAAHSEAAADRADSGTLREQIARALEETHLGGYGKSTWELMAAEVMAVVAPLVERLHQAERGQELLALALVDAHDELDEAQNRFLDLYNGTSGRQYSDMLRGMARRVGERRRDADRESKFRRASEIEMMAEVERLEESRFRWAEEAAELERQRDEAREKGHGLLDDLVREQTARANAEADARLLAEKAAAWKEAYELKLQDFARETARTSAALRI